MARLPQLLLGAAVCVALAGPVGADDVSKAEKVDQLVSLLWQGDPVEQIVNATATAKTQEALFRGIKAKIPDEKTKELQGKIREEIQKLVPVWRESLSKMYADSFSEEEIEAILTFQKTSAGAKLRKHSLDFANRAMLRFADIIRTPVEARIQTFLTENGVE